MNASLRSIRFTALVAVIAAFALTGCESLSGLSPTKRIEYKSAASGPSLELPPDLTTPRYDDRYAVTTATGLAAAGANKEATKSALLPQTPDAKIMRAGNERWLVVKSTPEQAWNTTREFWQESGFVLAVENPQIGFMETDFAENRAEIPTDIVRKTLGKVLDIFYSTYKQDKFRTRIERGSDGTVEIYISHRGMEQVPTGKIDNSSPAAFAWAVMPPNPALESEMLTRLMMKFGAPEQSARAAVVQASISPDRATIDRNSDGSYKLTVQDPFDRTWRRVGLALDRGGFTVVDRDRSRGVYFVRYGDPDALAAKANQAGLFDKLKFWKADEKDKPEQYQIVVAESAANSIVSVQDPGGVPDRSPTSEKILALLKDQLK